MSDYKDMTTEELGKMLANARAIVLNISQEIGKREPKPVEIPHYKLDIYRDDESSDSDSLVTASSVMHFDRDAEGFTKMKAEAIDAIRAMKPFCGRDVTVELYLESGTHFENATDSVD